METFNPFHHHDSGEKKKSLNVFKVAKKFFNYADASTNCLKCYIMGSWYAGVNMCRTNSRDASFFRFDTLFSIEIDWCGRSSKKLIEKTFYYDSICYFSLLPFTHRWQEKSLTHRKNCQFILCLTLKLANVMYEMDDRA